MFFANNDFALLGRGDRKRGDQSIELARREPGDILQAT
jgi:hypothetical protein